MAEQIVFQGSMKAVLRSTMHTGTAVLIIAVLFNVMYGHIKMSKHGKEEIHP